ncbi:MAG: response regulator [Flavipsychrobacter sp.]|nr:response regulator [Flavipsychrobacter sp.]
MKTNTILIADDDREDRELLEDILTSQHPGIHILSVSNGSEVFDLLDECDAAKLPEVLVLDYNMPLLNGAEVLSRMTADERYKGICVVMLSTSNAQIHVDQCKSMGARDYLVKPTDINGLQALGQKILGYFR